MQGVCSGHEAAIYGVAAFSVERRSTRKIPFRNGDGVSAEFFGRPCRFSAQTHARDRNTELEADKMIRFVHRSVIGGFIGKQTVLVEAAAYVIAVTCECNVNAPP